MRDYDQTLIYIENARRALDSILGPKEAPIQKLEELVNSTPGRKKELDDFRTLLVAGAMLFAMYSRCLIFRGRFWEAQIESTLEFYMCTLLHETSPAEDTPKKEHDAYCLCCTSLKEFNRLMWPEKETENRSCVVASHANFTMSPPWEFLQEAGSAYIETLKLYGPTQ